MSLVDVIIPTQFKPERQWSLVHQVKSALNQGVNARAVILCSEENFEKGAHILGRLLSDEEKNLTIFHCVRDGIKGDPWNEPRGYMSGPAMEAYINGDDCGVWQMHAADDDCLAPWALKYLLDASHGQSMVMGSCVAASRDYEDRRDYHLGTRMERCHINLACGILRTEAIRALEKPWFNPNSGYADWQLIDRMAQKFSCKFIPQVINIISLTL